MATQATWPVIAQSRQMATAAEAVEDMGVEVVVVTESVTLVEKQVMFSMTALITRSNATGKIH